MTEDMAPLQRWRHDIKNQLGIVLGFSELLLNELEPASPYRPDLAEIYAAARRALDLVAAMPGASPASDDKDDHD